MNSVEFMKSKNQILREFIGIDFDLIPETQMEVVPFIKLSNDLSTNSCPYCKEYLRSSNSCYQCPMDNGNNNCNEHGSTWNDYCTFMEDNKVLPHFDISSPAYEPMNSLIEEYNKSKEEK